MCLIYPESTRFSGFLYSQGGNLHSPTNPKTHPTTHKCSNSEVRTDKRFLKKKLSSVGGRVMDIKHIGHKQYRVIRIYGGRWTTNTFNLRRYKQ